MNDRQAEMWRKGCPFDLISSAYMPAKPSQTASGCHPFSVSSLLPHCQNNELIRPRFITVQGDPFLQAGLEGFV